MDARLESRSLSSNYTARNLFEDLLKIENVFDEINIFFVC